MTNVFMREVVGSLVLIVTGTIIFSICCNINSYHEYYYYVNSTLYIVTQVFFWIGLIFFVTGLINLFRASIRRRSPAFRGVTLSTAPQPMQPTSVTVIGTVLPSGYQREQFYPAGGTQQQIYPGQQQPYSMQPAYNNSQSLPVVPPPYSEIGNTEKDFSKN